MTTERIVTPVQLRDAYRRLQDRIAAAAERSNRRASDVVTVAVTKTATPDQIRTIVEMGHADLGENRVQHLAQRHAQLEEFLSRKRTLGGAVSRSGQDQAPAKVRWHMIGTLQRNKVKQVAPLVSLIHSVDSLRLAEELQAYASRVDRTLDILIQVNTAGEAQKGGVAPPAVLHFAEQIDTMMHLRLRGLMTMAPNTENPEEVRHVFARTAEMFHDIKSSGVVGGGIPNGGGELFNILSMGMSNDFEIAVEEGANLVRIGRALFGEGEENEETAED